MSGTFAAGCPLPTKNGGFHTGIHLFFFLKQTEQCLVWNVFKEKANSAEGGGTERGIVLVQKNMQRFRASVESEGLRFICQK